MGKSLCKGVALHIVVCIGKMHRETIAYEIGQFSIVGSVRLGQYHFADAGAFRL